MNEEFRFHISYDDVDKTPANSAASYSEPASTEKEFFLPKNESFKLAFSTVATIRTSEGFILRIFCYLLKMNLKLRVTCVLPIFF